MEKDVFNAQGGQPLEHGDITPPAAEIHTVETPGKIAPLQESRLPAIVLEVLRARRLRGDYR